MFAEALPELIEVKIIRETANSLVFRKRLLVTFSFFIGTFYLAEVTVEWYNLERGVIILMEKELKEILGLILSKLDSLESRQDEIYLVVKAIEHNNKVHGAEIDNLKYTISYVEGTINTIGDVITTRKAI